MDFGDWGLRFAGGQVTWLSGAASSSSGVSSTGSFFGRMPSGIVFQMPLGSELTENNSLARMARLKSEGPSLGPDAKRSKAQGSKLCSNFKA
jgi:hypothetical protein